VLSVDSGTELSLHLKLPGGLSLKEAHAIAEEVERAIERDVPEVRGVQTHLEPLAERAPGRVTTQELAGIEREIVELAGGPPRALRTLETDQGLVVLVTLAVDGSTPLADAHDRATAVSERIRAAHPGIATVVVHTEP
jgi:divalent metal cation (Fe/Co/Zn/Cd) transporter